MDLNIPTTKDAVLPEAPSRDPVVTSDDRPISVSTGKGFSHFIPNPSVSFLPSPNIIVFNDKGSRCGLEDSTIDFEQSVRRSVEMQVQEDKVSSRRVERAVGRFEQAGRRSVEMQVQEDDGASSRRVERAVGRFEQAGRRSVEMQVQEDGASSRKVERAVGRFEQAGRRSVEMQVQSSDSLDISSGFLVQNQILHRRPSVFDVLDEVAPITGGNGGERVSFEDLAFGFPAGDDMAGHGDGVPDSEGPALVSGNAGGLALNGHVAIDVPNNIELPNMVDHRQRLIEAGRRVKILWFLRFLVDGALMTCLENSVDLTNDKKFEVMFIVYGVLFAVWMIFSSIREELLEDPPYEKAHAFESAAAFLRFAYLVSLRLLHARISSTTNPLVYCSVRCVCSVVIKLVSALAGLWSLNDKLNAALAAHED